MGTTRQRWRIGCLAAIIAPVLFLYVWTHDSVTSAVKAGDHERLAALIKHGKDVNFRSKLTFSDAWEGNTPLHWAAAKGDPTAIEMLLQAGADPKAIATRFEMTPLHAMFWAGRRGNPNTTRCIELLVQAGVDVNAHQTNGGTALLSAVYANDASSAAVLIRNGADPYQRPMVESEFPMMRVLTKDEVRMLKVFVENGVDLDRRLTERDGSTRDFIHASRDMPRIKEYLASVENVDGGGER